MILLHVLFLSLISSKLYWNFCQWSTIQPNQGLGWPWNCFPLARKNIFSCRSSLCDNLLYLPCKILNFNRILIQIKDDLCKLRLLVMDERSTHYTTTLLSWLFIVFIVYTMTNFISLFFVHCLLLCSSSFCSILLLRTNWRNWYKSLVHSFPFTTKKFNIIKTEPIFLHYIF